VGVNLAVRDLSPSIASLRNSLKYQIPPFATYESIAPSRSDLTVNLTVKIFSPFGLLIFYRQTKIDIVRGSTNNELFRAPNPPASQFIGFFGEAHVSTELDHSSPHELLRTARRSS
jgi:hypothetical protein